MLGQKVEQIQEDATLAAPAPSHKFPSKLLRPFLRVMHELTIERIIQHDAFHEVKQSALQRTYDRIIAACEASKPADATYRGLTIQSSRLLLRVQNLRVLHQGLNRVADLSRWRIPGQITRRPIGWLDWHDKDDSTVLIGIWKHGFGHWDDIKLDSSLGLGNKIHRDTINGPLPTPMALQRRCEYLLELTATNLAIDVLPQAPPTQIPTASSLPQLTTIKPTEEAPRELSIIHESAPNFPAGRRHISVSSSSSRSVRQSRHLSPAFSISTGPSSRTSLEVTETKRSLSCMLIEATPSPRREIIDLTFSDSEQDDAIEVERLTVVSPPSKRRRSPDIEPNSEPRRLPRRPPRKRKRLSVREQLEAKWNALAFQSGVDERAPISFVNEVDDEEVPPGMEDFEYLEAEFRYGPNVPRPELIPKAFYATCKGPHVRCSVGPRGKGKAPSCECQTVSEIANKAFAYNEMGRFKFQRLRVDQELAEVVECNKFCTCSKDCPNRASQRPRSLPLEIYKTSRCGWGVRAGVRIEKGEVLGWFTGVLVTRDSAAETSYIFDYDVNVFEGEAPDRQKYSVSAVKCGNWTRFVNHSCDANLQVYNVAHEYPAGSGLGRLVFTATRPIPAGQPLTIDYAPEDASMELINMKSGLGDGLEDGGLRPDPTSLSVAGDVHASVRLTTCGCGSQKCRGEILL